MMNYEGKQLKDEFKAAFGFDISECTHQQLLWLTKFSKHIRGRCRSNAAFNNYMNRNFAPAKFLAVDKMWNGRPVKGLEIVAASGEKAEEEPGEE